MASCRLSDWLLARASAARGVSGAFRRPSHRLQTMLRRVSRVRELRGIRAAGLNCVYVGVPGRGGLLQLMAMPEGMRECSQPSLSAAHPPPPSPSPSLFTSTSAISSAISIAIAIAIAHAPKSNQWTLQQQRAPNPGDPPFALVRRTIWALHHPRNRAVL